MAKRYKTKVVFTHYVTDRLNVDKLHRLTYIRGHETIGSVYSRVKGKITTKLNVSSVGNVINLFEVRLRQKVNESILSSDAKLTYVNSAEVKKRCDEVVKSITTIINPDFDDVLEEFQSIKDNEFHEKRYTDNVIIDTTIVNAITELLLPEVDIATFELGNITVMPVMVKHKLPDCVIVDRKVNVGELGLLVLVNYY